MSSSKRPRDEEYQIDLNLLMGGEYETDNLRLMEIGNEVLEQIQKMAANESPLEPSAKRRVVMTIKGKADDEAIVCSKSNTFALKKAETTNSLFFMPCQNGNEVSEKQRSQDEGKSKQKDSDVAIHGPLFYVLELIPTKARLQKLRQVLLENPLTAEKDTSAKQTRSSQLYTFQDLLKMLPTSESELKAELERLGAFEKDGLHR